MYPVVPSIGGPTGGTPESSRRNAEIAGWPILPPFYFVTNVRFAADRPAIRCASEAEGEYNFRYLSISFIAAMRYRALIVEDEPHARNLLRSHLAKFGDDIEIIGEAADGPSAIRLIEALLPDVVFLDVNLPGKNAFEVIFEMKAKPVLIMTTAHPEFALAAHGTKTADYLLKPYDPDDLRRAIENLRELLPLPSRLLKDIHERVSPREYLPGVVCKVGDQKKVIHYEDIHYFQAEMKYTTVVSRHGKFLSETPLVDLEKILNPTEFLRIHRSTIMNKTHVVALRNLEDGRVEVRLKDVAVPLYASKTYSEDLKACWHWI